eukprot:4778985-Heterocapsa_arctica.AAC.1
MLGKRQHHRTQELHLRHRQQSIAGTMEHDEENVQYKHWTVPEKIDRPCANLMELSAKDGKELSKLGAVRIPRDRALFFVQSSRSTQEVWPTLVGCKLKGQENSLGYIVYKDLGNKRYKQALDKCLDATEPKGMGEEKTGDLVECIMGLGFLFQTHKCDEMEGIMELV